MSRSYCWSFGFQTIAQVTTMAFENPSVRTRSHAQGFARAPIAAVAGLALVATLDLTACGGT